MANYLLSGATGLIGSRLVKRLVEDGHKCVVLYRGSQPPAEDTSQLTHAPWDGTHIDYGPFVFDGIINLAGVGIADKRWTSAYKQLIQDSRLVTTRAVVDYLNDLPQKPTVYLNASAVGYYGTEMRSYVDESAPAGGNFLGRVAALWEAEAMKAQDVRTVLLRTGIVIAPEGGAFPMLLKPFQFYAGNYIGNGRQPFPWVHIQDVVNLIVFALENPSVEGPINLVAPTKDTNKSFAKAVGNALNIPVLFGMPSLMLKGLLGERAELLLKGEKVMPAKAQELGYEFVFTTAQAAIADVLAQIKAD